MLPTPGVSSARIKTLSLVCTACVCLLHPLRIRVAISVGWLRMCIELRSPHPTDISSTVIFLSVPGFIYVVQNILLFVALSHLPVTTFQVVYQLKILATAVFSRLILAKVLSGLQWAALGCLTAGAALVQVQSVGAKSSGTPADGDQFVGLCAVLLACCCSGFAGVWMEKLIKSSSIWARNIQLGVFGSLGCLCLMLTFDRDQLADKGFFHGYTPVTWFVVLNQAFGGLVVAVVIKYADNIVKGFANAISIVLGCFFSVFIFDFEVTVQFVLGATMVIVAVYLYGARPAPSPARHAYVTVPTAAPDTHTPDSRV